MNRPSAFDSHDPPQMELIDKCVHCGFCLPSCPTYVLWGEEMDSPRGRIYLMKAAAEGLTTISESFVGHFDACLGCMACVTACPSGVEYAPLVEATRAQIARRSRRPLRARRVGRGLRAARRGRAGAARPPFPTPVRRSGVPLGAVRGDSVPAPPAGRARATA